MTRSISGLMFSLVFFGLAFLRDDWGVAAEVSKTVSNRVAQVDVVKVFKESQYFRAGKEKIKETIALAENAAAAKVEGIQKLELEAGKLDSGSEELGIIEGRIKGMKSDFEESRKVAQRQFLQMESKHYHATYLKVIAVIEGYGDQHEFDLIIRKTSLPPADTSAQKIVDGLSNPVLYNRGQDITDDIIERLNQLQD